MAIRCRKYGDVPQGPLPAKGGISGFRRRGCDCSSSQVGAHATVADGAVVHRSDRGVLSARAPWIADVRLRTPMFRIAERLLRSRHRDQGHRGRLRGGAAIIFTLPVGLAMVDRPRAPFRAGFTRPRSRCARWAFAARAGDLREGREESCGCGEPADVPTAGESQSIVGRLPCGDVCVVFSQPFAGQRSRFSPAEHAPRFPQRHLVSRLAARSASLAPSRAPRGEAVVART